MKNNGHEDESNGHEDENNLKDKHEMRITAEVTDQDG
jgi:hypothetical protein